MCVVSCAGCVVVGGLVWCVWCVMVVVRYGVWGMVCGVHGLSWLWCVHVVCSLPFFVPRSGVTAYVYVDGCIPLDACFQI